MIVYSMLATFPRQSILMLRVECCYEWTAGGAPGSGRGLGGVVMVIAEVVKLSTVASRSSMSTFAVQLAFMKSP